MRNLRKEDLSVYYYLKDFVLSDFIEIEYQVSLDYLDEVSAPNCSSYVYEAQTEMLPNPTDRGRGWVYFDVVSGTGLYCIGGMPVREQSNMVVVYDNVGNVINENKYMVDYVDGRIITSGSCNPAYVDYYWNYVSLVDEWGVVEASEPPVIVLDIEKTDKSGYQIGPGKKVVRSSSAYIFASNVAERNDLTEAVYDGLYLKSCLLQDFPNGTALDYDGTFYGRRSNMDKDSTLFDRSVVDGISKLEFHNVSARNVNLPILMARNSSETMLSDLNAYRSKVSFDLVSYTNV